jgi:hypothetical protein
MSERSLHMHIREVERMDDFGGIELADDGEGGPNRYLRSGCISKGVVEIELPLA